jgi:hypothetical protein
MGGGMMLLGNEHNYTQNETKKSGPKILGGEVTYTITYQGPADGRIFSPSGVTFDITLKDKDGNEYKGKCWMRLTKNEKGGYDIQIKIHAVDGKGNMIDIDYDSKRDGGKPAQVTFQGVTMKVVADIKTDNDVFNKNMSDGTTTYVLATNPITGEATTTLTFEPHKTDAIEGWNIKKPGLLKIEHAGADYIEFVLQGFAGQTFDAKIYNVQGQEVRTLGSSGLRATLDNERLQFDLNGLGAGVYYLVIIAEKAKISQPFIITK